MDRSYSSENHFSAPASSSDESAMAIFAEESTNPAPELVSSEGTGMPTSPNNDISILGVDTEPRRDRSSGYIASHGSESGPAAQENGSGDSKDEGLVIPEPQNQATPWYNKLFWESRGAWLKAFVIVAVGLAALMIPLGLKGAFSDGLPQGSSAVGNLTSSQFGATSKATVFAGATATTPSSSSQPTPGVCEPSYFIQNVTWTGIWGATSGWSFSILNARDAAGCCEQCYNTTGQLAPGTSCNAWQWDMDNAVGVACTILTNFAGGTNKDEFCLHGYCSPSFATANGGDYIGGVGPCGGPAHINGNLVGTSREPSTQTGAVNSLM